MGEYFGEVWTLAETGRDGARRGEAGRGGARQNIFDQFRYVNRNVFEKCLILDVQITMFSASGLLL